MPTCIFIEGWVNNALTNNWIVMNFIQRLLSKFGLANAHADRHPIRIFLLEDDERRCEWFAKRFKGDELDVACDVEQAKELMQTARCAWSKNFAAPVDMPSTFHFISWKIEFEISGRGERQKSEGQRAKRAFTPFALCSLLVWWPR